MARVHLFRPLQDAAGNLQRGATVRLYRAGTSVLADDVLYTTDSGIETYSQPVACPTGFLDVYLDYPQRFRIGVTPFGGGTEVFFDDVDFFQTKQPANETPIESIGGMNSLDVQSALAELMAIKYGQDQPLPRPTAVEIATDQIVGIDASDVQGALQDLQDGEDALDARLDANEALDVVQTGRLDDHDDRFDGLETDVAAHESRLDLLEPQVTDHETRIDALEAAQPAFSIKTANYTLVAGDYTVFFDGADLTATLPTPAGVAGKQYVIKNTHLSNLTVTPTAGLIDGDANRILAQYDSLTLVSDGTNWGVI